MIVTNRYDKCPDPALSIREQAELRAPVLIRFVAAK